MTSEDHTDSLKSIFESVTGDTTVVESQEEDIDKRAIEESRDSEPVDAIDHHGFGDVIDSAEPADDAL